MLIWPKLMMRKFSGSVCCVFWKYKVASCILTNLNTTLFLMRKSNNAQVFSHWFVFRSTLNATGIPKIGSSVINV